jgi:AcrR family transcriptional regulator
MADEIRIGDIVFRIAQFGGETQVVVMCSAANPARRPPEGEFDLAGKHRGAPHWAREEERSGSMNQTARRLSAYNVQTPDRLLDAAERLFAHRNYQTVTLKEIAAEAGANVGQIAYHFGKKEALVKETIRRRAEELNSERLALLEQYEELVGPDSVEVDPLVRALILPYYNKLDGADAQWRHFATFIGRSVWDGTLSDYMSESFDAVAKLYISAFMRAMPTLRHADAIRGFHFLMAVMHSATVEDPRVAGLLEAASADASGSGYRDLVVPYISAGFKALATARADEP